MLARTVARRALGSRLAAPGRRLLTTAATPKKKGNWKGTAFRWGLAGAGLYYYNTNDFFGEQEQAAIDRLEESIHHIQQSELPTIEAIVAEKHARAAARAAEEVRKADAELAAIAAAKAAAEAESRLPEGDEEAVAAAAALEAEEQTEGGSIEELETEADQQGAFNPETGEINWDCPCLGGMAHGPCGPEFREAFSCFVYSKEEPKGMECIDKFKGMQDCFRAHPEMYGSELEDDEDELEAEINAQEAAKAAARGEEATAASARPEESFEQSSEPKALENEKNGQLVPKATLDAGASANEEKK